MKWSLDIDIPKPARQIHHSDSLLLIGSCFTDNIGKMMKELKFDVRHNPTGILFDPDSVNRHLKDFVDERIYTIDDLQNENGLYFSWNHHSRFANVNAEKCLLTINAAVEEGAKSIRKVKWCVITLGSAFAYKLIPQNHRVANCHKAPANYFEKEMMTSNEIVKQFDETFAAILKINPTVQFILTVSPVRHSRDGLVENNRSKARLIEAVQQLKEKNNYVHYFPAYELVIDVLRDYRFYDIDMVHPNYAATQFVYEKFCDTWLDADTVALLDEIKQVVTAANHKPQHPDTEAHKQFLKLQLEKTLALSHKTTWCDWKKELEYFKSL